MNFAKFIQKKGSTRSNVLMTDQNVVGLTHCSIVVSESKLIN